MKETVKKHRSQVISKKDIGKVLSWAHIAINNAKRQLLNTYYQIISPRYLKNCLNEFCYRFNRRYFEITLYVVAQSYPNIKKMYYEQATIPGIIFGINEEFYGTPGQGNSYIHLFVNDLIKDATLTDNELLHLYYNTRFLFFNNGKLTSFSDSLESDEAVK